MTLAESCQVQLDHHRYWIKESIRLGCPGSAAVYERAAEMLRRYMVRNGLRPAERKAA